MSGNGLENALEEAKDTLHFFRVIFMLSLNVFPRLKIQ